MTGRPYADALEIYPADQLRLTGRIAINRLSPKFRRWHDLNLLLDGTGMFVFGDNTTIAGDFIGTDASGMVAHGNEVSGIDLFSSNNTIAGTNPADRNVHPLQHAAGIGITGKQKCNSVRSISATSSAPISPAPGPCPPTC